MLLLLLLLLLLTGLEMGERWMLVIVVAVGCRRRVG
jgi:hypothetical protein